MDIDQHNEDDDLICYGTALPYLDEHTLSVRKKPERLEDQIVTDENGRRRFHGAFTGGFSAGYFNTVGSRDGWKPQQFVSSRLSKRSEFVQNATDFMDDEDMGQFGFGYQKLKTSSQFSRSIEPSASSNGLGIPVLEKLFKPVLETIGDKLLRNMGWKPGQGIGPRISKLRRKKRLQSHNRLYMSSEAVKEQKNEEDSVDIEERYKDFLFAPDELPTFLMNPKCNTFGLGFEGLQRPDLSATVSSQLKMITGKKRRLDIRGHAFGVGVYDGADRYDEIYQRDDMMQYDFSLEDEDNELMSPRSKSKSRWDKQDAEIIIDGFHRAKYSVSKVQNSTYNTVVPDDFKPIHKIKKSRFDVEASTNKDASMHSLPTPKEAAIIANSLCSIRPFSNDASKQKRYEQYLACIKNNRHDALAILQPKSMTEWERHREAIEFSRAATLYRPLTGEMGSKFVSAGTSDDLLLTKKIQDPVSADLTVFGPLTHGCEKWIPAKLLCVRFNIKQPYLDEKEDGSRPLSSSTKSFSIFGDLTFPSQPTCISLSLDDDAKIKTKSIDETSDVFDCERPKPSMDLFKSIFLDTDSEDDEKEEERQTEVVIPTSTVPPESVLPRKAATGVFANIDFIAMKNEINLKCKEENLKTMTTTKEEVKEEVPVKAIQNEELQMFGPVRPPHPLCSSKKSKNDSNSYSSSKHKEKKSEHKKKSKKHRHKSSKKKKK